MWPRLLPTPTLAAMPLVEKTTTPPPMPPPTADDAWDPDPIVLVSRRDRSLYFPGALLRGDPSSEQIKVWTNPQGRVGERDERFLKLTAGVNFLGTLTSSWLYRTFDGRTAPQGPPAVDKCILLYPDTNGRDALTSPRGGHIDRETGRLIPARVKATIGRVLDYHRKHMSAGDDDLWTTPDGFDAPELVLMPLSQIFAQASPEAAGAHTTTVQSIRFLRRTPAVAATLGALHDYAVRSRAGAAIVGECRQWWTRKKLG